MPFGFLGYRCAGRSRHEAEDAFLNMRQNEYEMSDLLKANAFYSTYFKDLVEQLQEDSALQRRRLDLESADVIEFMRDYDSKVSAWPVFISQKLVSEFNTFIKVLPGVMYKALGVIHRRNPEGLKEHLGFTGFDLMHSAPFKSEDLLIRYDMVFTDQVFKVVEVNSGSTIGGWQLDWLYENFRDSIGNLKCSNNWEYKYTNMTRCLVRSVIRSMSRLRNTDGSGNLLVLDGDSHRKKNRKFHQVLSSVFDQVKGLYFPSARIFYIKSLKEIGFRPDGKVVFKNHIIDGLLLSPHESIKRDVVVRLTASFLGGRLAFPDSPFHGLVGNKLALALLHDPHVKSELSELENQIIEKHIPWGARASSSEFTWRGRSYTSDEFYRELKDDIVLKKSRSFQGKDVVVGRFSTSIEWEKTLRGALASRDWLVQEYCPPDPVVVCDDYLGITPFELVWGIFHLSDEYGGAFVRGVPGLRKEKTNRSGVINSSQGAREFPVFEEKYRAV